MSTLDTTLLGVEVKDMCRRVAQAPQGAFHFRMGQQVAERLSYPPEPLRRITFRAVESFAGVGQVQNAGRLAIADIVSETQLTEAIVCNADLWAACIGGAAQQDTYCEAIEAAGLHVVDVHTNPYEFISEQAKGATARFGVKSISLLAAAPHE